MDKPVDVEGLAKQLVDGRTPEELRAILDGLMSGRVASIFEKLHTTAEPVVSPPPSEVHGFRVRLDLRGAKPPVWRRLELPGDMTLRRLHDVIQAAMGWSDGHLHRFRTGDDHRSPYFVTPFDLEEGDEGVLEDDVRLDQLVSARGDALWYEYDFGDGWDHALAVEEVLADVPATARCIDGRMACPPEDCGGIGGYDELAAWVRSGCDASQLPQPFDDAEDAWDWLPIDWHPDRFDVAEADAAVTAAAAEPVAVSGEVAELLAQLDRRGVRALREVLGRPASHASTAVSDDDAARLTESYRVLLDVLGDGVALTSAGYLPPKLVEQLSERMGITAWWIGKGNRDDLTSPVATVRDTARALGLVTVRRGRLTPTKAAGLDPVAMLDHIAARLPLGTKDFERQAGWMALAVVGSGTPADRWHDEVVELMVALGWTTRGGHPTPTRSPTLAVLEQLAGTARSGGRLSGTDPALAAVSRSVIAGRPG